MDKGLGNKADSELDIINTISPADIAFIMSTTYVLCWFQTSVILKSKFWRTVINKGKNNKYKSFAPSDNLQQASHTIKARV